MRPMALQHDANGLIDAERCSVGSHARQRVEDISNRRDPALERYVSASKPSWVAVAVETLMVGQSDPSRYLEQDGLRPREYPIAGLTVGLDRPSLVIRQRSRLAQDLLRNRNLSDIVEWGGEPHELALGRVEAG